MLPFIGYHVGDYFKHWIQLKDISTEEKLPKIFYVNWFRRGKDGRFLWPGFGENSRVLKWVIDRVEGRVTGVDSPIGLAPRPEDLEIEGLDIRSDDLAEALVIDKDEWSSEIPLIEEWFAKIGPKLPAELKVELETLKSRIR
jgi:phosphoenolpyruvate carboxykinase (GTP)